MKTEFNSQVRIKKTGKKCVILLEVKRNILSVKFPLIVPLIRGYMDCVNDSITGHH